MNQRATTVVLAVLALALGHCATTPSESGGPVVLGVTPDSGYPGEHAEVTAEGRSFEPVLFRNASCGGATIDVDDTFAAAWNGEGTVSQAGAGAGS